MWVIFALLDPDPDSEYGSGSTDPIEYGSNTDPGPDPDPQPWFKIPNSVADPESGINFPDPQHRTIFELKIVKRQLIKKLSLLRYQVSNVFFS